jgi:hypothetical protein
MSSKRKSRQIQSPETEVSDGLSPTTQRQQRSRRSINPSNTNGFGNPAEGDQVSEPDEDSPVPRSQKSKKRKIENGSVTQQRNGKGKERVLAQRAETVDCSDEEEPVDPLSHKSNGLAVSRGVRDSEGSVIRFHKEKKKVEYTNPISLSFHCQLLAWFDRPSSLKKLRHLFKR